MRQPELGQKITALRKSKNLTQEELVDACHVSVRTIQRIESGEVTPRTSTIKIILAALGEDLRSFHDSGQTNEDIELERAENSLQIAWIAGIIYFIVGFLEAGLDYTRFEEGDGDIPWEFYTSVKVIALISYVLFMGGLAVLGNFFSNSILKIAAYLMIGFTSIILIFDVFTLFFPVSNDTLMLILPSESISIGAAEIILGIGLIKLQDGMGRMALLAGVLELIIGFCFLVVILFILGYILLIPALILEIVILYKGYEFIKSERRKEISQTMKRQ